MNGEKLASRLISEFDANSYQYLGDWKAYRIIASSNTKLMRIEYEEIDSKRAAILEYPIVTLDDIKLALLNGESINLDYCYVDNFNYSQLENSKKLILRDFSAKCAFFNGNTMFIDAIFEGVCADFYCANFSDGVVNFECSTFRNCDLNFTGANLGETNIDFTKSHFENSNKFFYNTNFGRGYVYFSDVTFGDGDIFFDGANFQDGDVWFLNATFGTGTVDFTDAIFKKGQLWFLNAKFQKNTVTFQNTKFGESEISFDGVVAIDSRFIFKECIFSNHVNLRFQEVYLLEIIDCTIEKTLLLDFPSKKRERSIKKLSVEKCRNLGQLYVDWDIAKKAIKTYNNLECATMKDSYISKANQFRMLKENYHTIGEYDNEDEAFVEYMRYKRRSTASFFKKLGYYIIDNIGKYGTSPFRVFNAMIVTIMSFGFVFSDYISITEIATKEELHQGYNGLIQGVYFSLITFLTIGYGDISPINTITAFLAGVEGFAGLFLMSYFTVAIVRKTLR